MMTKKGKVFDFPENPNRDSRAVAYKQVIAYNEAGEVVYDNRKRQVHQNGSGFVVSYTQKICELLTEIPTGSVLRIFFYLAHNQQFGNDGKQFGYRCSKKYLEDVLNLDRKSVYNSLKFLREKFLVLETKIDGQSEFMVNPNYITIGADKKTRLREWSRRWEEHFKATGGKI